MSQDIKWTIIGGGIIGISIAYKLSQTFPQDDICIIEKHDSLFSENQTSRNSGVIHSGIYYDRNYQPLKAKLSVIGNSLLYNFCKKYDIPHKKTGKLVVGSNKREKEYLKEVEKIAIENGIPDFKWLKHSEIKKIEPMVDSEYALYFPTTGIIEPTLLLKKISDLFEKNGGYILIGTEVISLKNLETGIEVTTISSGEKERFQTEYLINCAGLFADDIGKLFDESFPYTIEGVRGETAKFYKKSRKNIDMNGLNVYPAPYVYYNSNGKKADIDIEIRNILLKKNEVTKTTGVHLTPTFDFINNKYVIGNIVTIGPQKNVGKGKYNYGEALYPPESFLKYVKDFFPNLKSSDIELYQAGIMAVAKDHPDWIIEKSKLNSKMINLIGMDSPALTSCLSIADYVVDNFCR